MIRAHFENIRFQLIKEISFAEKSLKVAVAWFTNNELFDAIIQKCKENVLVEIIIINDSINLKKFGLDFNLFIKEGGILYFGDTDKLMHHKFCIIDEKVLINGSYNWTYWAESKNEENITIIKDESDILQGFSYEFDKLVSTKSPLKSIEPEMLNPVLDNDSFYNLKTIKINEYISSAIDLGSRGNQEMAAYIFEEVLRLNPIKANIILKNGVASENKVLKNIYQKISEKNHLQFKESSYGIYCNIIYNYLSCGNYIYAIEVANACAAKYPRRFSVHVYCGDAKTKLNDILGAEIEYRKALSYKHQPKSKILYYDKVYNYLYFPYADIYLKLGQKDKVVEVLQEAVHHYKKLNNSNAVAIAEKYLNRIAANEVLLRIE